MIIVEGLGKDLLVIEVNEMWGVVWWGFLGIFRMIFLFIFWILMKKYVDYGVVGSFIIIIKRWYYRKINGKMRKKFCFERYYWVVKLN